MKHIQNEFEGKSVQRWELDHNIVRIVRGDCEYVVCRDWDAFQRQAEEEREQRRREFIAEQQAAAYLEGTA